MELGNEAITMLNARLVNCIINIYYHLFTFVVLTAVLHYFKYTYIYSISRIEQLIKKYPIF